MRNLTIQETRMVGDAIARVVALLPVEWSFAEARESPAAVAGVDVVVELVGPSGNAVRFAAEVRRSGSIPTSLLITVLRDIASRTRMPVLYVSDYIGRALREGLAAEGISYADTTGWVRIVSADPLILLTGAGSPRAPRDRRTNAVVRLNGLAANRLIRALATVQPPVGVRSLAVLAGVSPGSVSKLLSTLAAEGIVDRNPEGKIDVVRRRALIRRWTTDYAFAETNSAVAFYLAPRGIDRTLPRLAELSMEVAMTGSSGARLLLPAGRTSVVPLRLLSLYAADPPAVAQELGLIETEPRSANVVIARPQDPDILNDGKSSADVGVAPTPLVLADMLTLPGRSDAEAEQLFDSLAATDPAWST
ncbi:MAG: helix-turn-helix domain-containing protein [Austwickia sp.]|nr:helix-turn-helix domain-containing protein [Actinomycetota bacterium]MCB1252319.1 helix-turn-helix domain-containing protein [Austwickia sp.]MCO5309555.1 helix-turn-helix domain-containing protein [Austwickia sp.]